MIFYEDGLDAAAQVFMMPGIFNTFTLSSGEGDAVVSGAIKMGSRYFIFQ